MNKLTNTAARHRTLCTITLTSLTLSILSGCSSGSEYNSNGTTTASVDGNNVVISAAPQSASNSTETPTLGAANAGSTSLNSASDVLQLIEPVVFPVPTTTPVDIQPAVISNSSSKKVKLVWERAAIDDLGYYVYYSAGPDENYLLAKQVTLSPALPMQQHQAQFDTADDLGLNINDTVCFTVSAWSTFGESSRSAPMCTQINS